MRRREFVTLLGGAVTARPLTALAQQSALPVIGWLGAAGPNDRLVAAFRAALAEAGYIEGRNVVIDYRFAEGRYDRLPAMAEELVRARVAVIVASPTPTALVSGQGRERDCSSRFRSDRRSGQAWPCRRLRPAGQQCHGRVLFYPIWPSNNWACCANLLPPPSDAVCWSIPTMRTLQP